MFSLVSHYPDFLITSCIYAFENYVQSITLYGLSFAITLVLPQTAEAPVFNMLNADFFKFLLKFSLTPIKFPSKSCQTS